MKFICEMTKEDFERCRIDIYDKIIDKILDADEFIDEIESRLDNFCFSDFSSSDLECFFIDTEIKIDGLSPEDFLKENKEELWEIFKMEHPEMVKKETTEVNCCYNCSNRGPYIFDKGECFCPVKSKTVKPNEYCEEGEFKE